LQCRVEADFAHPVYHERGELLSPSVPCGSCGGPSRRSRGSLRRGGQAVRRGPCSSPVGVGESG
jgi:hypothetical protein